MLVSPYAFEKLFATALTRSSESPAWQLKTKASMLFGNAAL